MFSSPMFCRAAPPGSLPWSICCPWSRLLLLVCLLPAPWFSVLVHLLPLVHLLTCRCLVSCHFGEESLLCFLKFIFKGLLFTLKTLYKANNCLPLQTRGFMRRQCVNSAPAVCRTVSGVYTGPSPETQVTKWVKVYSGCNLEPFQTQNVFQSYYLLLCLKLFFMKYFKHIEKLKFLKQISVWSPSILNKVQFDL